MIVIGHRGTRNLAPENTLAAIVEFDISLSADGIPVAVHEETLACDSDRNELVLSPRDIHRDWVSELTLEQIKELDAGILTFTPQILSLFRSEFPEIRTVLGIWTDLWPDIGAIVARANACDTATVTVADFMVIDQPTAVQQFSS